MADGYWDKVIKKYSGKNSIDGGPVPLRRWMDPPLNDQSPKDTSNSRPHQGRTGTKKTKK